jgi:hypothetical protein
MSKQTLFFAISTLAGIFLTGCSEQQAAPNSPAQPGSQHQIKVINPGFESSATAAEGWTVTQHTGEAAYESSIDTRHFTEGKQSFRITRIREQWWGMLSQYIDLPASAKKKITLSAMVKTEALGDKGFQLALHFRKSSSKFISDEKSKLISGNTDWQKIEFSAVIPEKTAIVQIAATLLDDGSAWIDDVKLAIEK